MEDEEGYNVLDMSDVAAIIAAAGVPVEYGHSGGNCATFYVGNPWTDVNGDRRYPVLSGVGYVGPDGKCFIATGGDCAVGFDDTYGYGVSDGCEPEYVTGPDVTAQDLADVILRWFEVFCAIQRDRSPEIAPDILAYWEGRTYARAAGYSVPMAEDFAEWFSTFGRWDVAAEFDAYVPADQ